MIEIRRGFGLYLYRDQIKAQPSTLCYCSYVRGTVPGDDNGALFFKCNIHLNLPFSLSPNHFSIHDSLLHLEHTIF